MYIFCTFIITPTLDLKNLCMQYIYKFSVLYNIYIHLVYFLYKFYGKGLLSYQNHQENLDYV